MVTGALLGVSVVAFLVSGVVGMRRRRVGASAAVLLLAGPLALGLPNLIAETSTEDALRLVAIGLALSLVVTRGRLERMLDVEDGPPPTAPPWPQRSPCSRPGDRDHVPDPPYPVLSALPSDHPVVRCTAAVDAARRRSVRTHQLVWLAGVVVTAAAYVLWLA